MTNTKSIHDIEELQQSEQDEIDPLADWGFTCQTPPSDTDRQAFSQLTTLTVVEEPYPDREARAELPEQVPYEETEDLLEGHKFAVYTLGTVDKIEKLIEAISKHDHVCTEEERMAVYVKQFSSLRDAFDDFLILRETSVYMPQFFAAAEPDWQDKGVLAICLDADEDHTGKVRVARCEDASYVWIIGAGLCNWMHSWYEYVSDYEEAEEEGLQLESTSTGQRPPLFPSAQFCRDLSMSSDQV